MANPSSFEIQKLRYLDLESNLESLVSNKEFQDHYQAWLNATMLALEDQFNTCDSSLAELQRTIYVDEGQYWNFRTLAQHCNLSLDQKRLIHRGQPIKSNISLPEAVDLLHTLNGLKKRSFVTNEQREFLDKAQAELKNVVFERRELKLIINGLRTKLSSEIESQAAGSDIEGFRKQMDDLNPRLIELENLIEAARMNGDMAVAEHMSYKQLELYEEMLRIISEQYPVLQRQHAASEDFKRRRRWSVFRMANKDVTCVVEAKSRQIEACMDDVRKIEEQLLNYNTDDKYQRKRYELDRSESDQFLDENQAKQRAVWNRVKELHDELVVLQDELSNLAAARRKEVDRRLQVEEREAGRRSGHEAFLRVAEKYQEELRDTIDNAQAASDVARALNEFILDGCDSITARFDKQQDELAQMLSVVQRQHFKHFTDFYVAAGRLLYHKEKLYNTHDERIRDKQRMLELAAETLDPIAKKHSTEREQFLEKRKAVLVDISSLKERVAAAESQVIPVLRAFEHRGVPFKHPKEVLLKMNLDRQERIVNLRDEEDRKDVEQLRVEHEDVVQQRLDREQRQQIKPPKAPVYAYPSVQQQYSRYAKLLESSPSSSKPPASNVGGKLGAASERFALRDQQPPEKGSTSSSNQPTPQKAAPSGGAIQVGSTVKALFPYRAQANDELSFDKNETIVCVSAVDDDGWFLGACNQKVGIFPTNFVQVVEDW